MWRFSFNSLNMSTPPFDPPLPKEHTCSTLDLNLENLTFERINSTSPQIREATDPPCVIPSLRFPEIIGDTNFNQNAPASLQSEPSQPNDIMEQLLCQVSISQPEPPSAILEQTPITFNSEEQNQVTAPTTLEIPEPSQQVSAIPFPDLFNTAHQVGNGRVLTPLPQSRDTETRRHVLDQVSFSPMRAISKHQSPLESASFKRRTKKMSCYNRFIQSTVNEVRILLSTY